MISPHHFSFWQKNTGVFLLALCPSTVCTPPMFKVQRLLLHRHFFHGHFPFCLSRKSVLVRFGKTPVLVLSHRLVFIRRVHQQIYPDISYVIPGVHAPKKTYFSSQVCVKVSFLLLQSVPGSYSTHQQVLSQAGAPQYYVGNTLYYEHQQHYVEEFDRFVLAYCRRHQHFLPEIKPCLFSGLPPHRCIIYGEFTYFLSLTIEIPNTPHWIF